MVFVAGCCPRKESYLTNLKLKLINHATTSDRYNDFDVYCVDMSMT